MTVYLFAVVLSLALPAFIRGRSIRKNKILYLSVVFGVTFLITALRSASVGIDTPLFIDVFKNVHAFGVNELPRNTQVEKGYVLLCYAFGRLFGAGSYQIMFALTGGIISFAFARIIYKYSRSVEFSTFLYVACILPATLNVFRQYTALALLLLAYDGILDKKIWRAVLFTLLAYCFHMTAILFLPLVLLALPKVKWDSRWVVAAFVSSIALFIAYAPMVRLITMVFPQYARFFSSTKFMSTQSISPIYAIVFLYTIVMMALLFVDFKRRELDGKWRMTRRIACASDEFEEQALMFFFMMFFGYLLTYLISTKIWIASRFVYYFQFSLLLALPNAFECVKRLTVSRPLQKFRKLAHATMILVVLLLFAFFVYYLNNDPHGIVPYQIFLSD